MFGEHFRLDEQTVGIVEQTGKYMSGGFFIYKAWALEELLYANRAVIDDRSSPRCCLRRLRSSSSDGRRKRQWTI